MSSFIYCTCIQPLCWPLCSKSACGHTRTCHADACRRLAQCKRMSLTVADTKQASATALLDRPQPGGGPGEATSSYPSWTHQQAQQGSAAMPHRHRGFIRSSMSKLFGRSKAEGTLTETACRPDKQVSHQNVEVSHLCCQPSGIAV